MSDGSDIDLAALGFDASKQLTTNGPAQQGVTFAEGDNLEEVEPPTLRRTVREDVAYPKNFEKHVRVKSNLIMETKQSDEQLLEKEAHEVFVSRKFRHQLLDQYLKKVRWRFNNEKKLESNAKLVEWEDGSYTIFVGDKHYDIDGESPANEMLYTVQDDVMIMQDRINYSGRINQVNMPSIQ